MTHIYERSRVFLFGGRFLWPRGRKILIVNNFNEQSPAPLSCCLVRVVYRSSSPKLIVQNSLEHLFCLFVYFANGKNCFSFISWQIISPIPIAINLDFQSHCKNNFQLLHYTCVCIWKLIILCRANNRVKKIIQWFFCILTLLSW